MNYDGAFMGALIGGSFGSVWLALPGWWPILPIGFFAVLGAALGSSMREGS